MRRTALLIGVVLLVVVSGCAEVADDGDPADWLDDANDADDADDANDVDDTADDESTDDGEAHVDGTLEIHAINVGQADATLVIGPTGETMLIDSGDWRNDGQIVIDYLESHDISRIDHLVSTHGHADHIGGHAAVIEHFETERDGIGAVWDSGVAHTSQTYDRYLDAVEEHEVTLFRTQEGDEIPMEGVEANVFNPPADSDSNDLHYNSVTVHLTYGNVSFLATGDAESDAERRMIEEHGEALGADIYHAGHHGSSTSSTESFLDTVRPRVAIVSAAYESQYGHPHEEVLQAFADRDVATYWTATHGTIVFEVDGETITVSTQADATTDPLELRDEPETDADPAAPGEVRETFATTTTHDTTSTVTTTPNAYTETSQREVSTA